MFSRIHKQLHLYRRRSFWASGTILLASLALTASAAPYQHRIAHKLRATALVELTTDQSGTVTTHVFPITILANGSFHDASVYESRPRPLALDNGVVYEVQKTGISLGYVTITNGSNTPEGWIALGKWQALSQIQAKAKPKPAAPNVAATDDRPILHREGQTPEPTPTPTPTPNQTQSTSSDSDRPAIHRGGGNPEPTPVPAPDETDSAPSGGDRPVLHRSGGGSQPTPTPTPNPAPSAPDDSNHPVLHRSDGSSQPTPTPTPNQTPSAPDDSNRPVLHRGSSDDQQTSGSQGQSTGQTGNQPSAQTEPEAPPDPNRPVLRRRKPGDTDEAVPAPVASKTTPSATTPGKPQQSVTSAPLPVNTPGTQNLVAVSDAESTDSRSYEYHWKPEEQPQIEAKMRKLALAQLPGEEAQTSDHSMTNVVIRSFDLDLSNDAVVVITAEVPGAYLPSKARTAHTTAKSSEPKPEQKFVSRYVTVIARVDIDGNPQKLAASVTDSSRLDVAPRLELIDAVDVDGDGLAELIFREYGFDQRTFIVYGVGHGTVTKVFEGASEPILK